MEEKKINRNTCLFNAFLLLAGVANLLAWVGIPTLETLMTEANYLIYVGLTLFWLQSVQARLLASREKTWVTGAAWMMLLYQLLRVFKYRFAVEPAAMRYAIYLYFVPMTLIPTLFLMTCLHIRRRNRTRRRNEVLLLIPQGLFSLLALTNDLHGLVYAPRVALSAFAVDTGTYAHGPVFYALYAWMILCLAAGFLLLLLKTARQPGKALLSLLVVVAVWCGLLLTNVLFQNGIYGPHMYNSPEIHMFGMLGVFEICIRYRLIPHNANYAVFLEALKTPALVTDRTFCPAYRSGAALCADADQLRAALTAPVYLTPDLKISGREVRGGYAFWAEDEAEIHRAQERLAEANELIESENNLIQAETEQREKDAWLQSRHRVYHEIAEIMYPVQRRIEGLLEQMEPNTSAFREHLAVVCVLNAYVKRKTNLLLLSAEKESLTTHDLYLALKESAVDLTQAGLRTDVGQPEEAALPSDRVIALYDAFEAVAERLIGDAHSLMVSMRPNALVLAADTARVPDTAALPVSAQAREEEGILYLELFAEKGGDRA